MEAALLPFLADRVDRPATRLVQVLLNTLSLEQHLHLVRQVFLLEAGDLMSEFYTAIFTGSAASYEEGLLTGVSRSAEAFSFNSSVSITMLLHDRLGRGFRTEEVERFSITLQSEPTDSLVASGGTSAAKGGSSNLSVIDKLNLTYHVDCPLNLVLHRGTLVKYNRVFGFLLKIKHALWALHEIDLKSLNSVIDLAHSHLGRRRPPHQEPGFAAAGGRGVTKELRAKLSRVTLLRAWLLHLVGSVHSHVMTRVLHSTNFEMYEGQRVLRVRGENGEAPDLGSIIEAHNRYIDTVHDRCFLGQSADVLRGAILKMLNTCRTLHLHCSQFVAEWDRIVADPEILEDYFCDLAQPSSSGGICPKPQALQLISEKLLDNLEQNYVRSHQFLAATLKSFTQKRNVPHLEGLATSLICTLPSAKSTS